MFLALCNLKLVASEKPSIEVKLGGELRAPEMAPGVYTANCQSAWTDKLNNGIRATFQFCVIAPDHEGTALRMWVQVSDAGGIISPVGRYAKYCAIALGRPLTKRDDFGNPGSIFSTLNFSVLVGYSKTEQSKGGAFSDKNMLVKKYPGDYLRVHDILERVTL